MSERNKILDDYFLEKKKEEEWNNLYYSSLGEYILNYYGNKAYEKWAIKNKIKIHIFKKETQMQKLWKNTFGKIYATIYRFGTWYRSFTFISRTK